MSSSSRRTRRMERSIQRHKPSALNLVSLMDIFTILVFFLLVSSSNVQQLPGSKDIRLPASVAQKQPAESLVVHVSAKYILVAGSKVVDLESQNDEQGGIFPELAEELKFHASRSYFSPSSQENGRTVTILGDETIPYSLLRKILATCRQANYRHVAFAANQKAKGKA